MADAMSRSGNRHGGGSTIDSNFGRVLPFLASTRRVIALEEQGHGRTSDRDQPFTFEGRPTTSPGCFGT
jgi:pimeloyl-ACP methyl ester carboxylesterase